MKKSTAGKVLLAGTAVIGASTAAAMTASAKQKTEPEQPIYLGQEVKQGIDWDGFGEEVLQPWLWRVAGCVMIIGGLISLWGAVVRLLALWGG